MNYQELIAFALYMVVVLTIGVVFFFKTKSGNEKDYFLGGRQMNSWVTAISAQASDMSGWLLMGLPGSILAFGVGQVWIAIGLLIGTTLNWIFTAPRLRNFSRVANDSITIPEYLSNRFMTKNKTLRILCALVFFVCYAVYAASSFKACGTLFNTVFGFDPTFAIYLAAGVILCYTLLGGFNAVCWTDLIQGMLMLAALLIVPIAAMISIQSGMVQNSMGDLVSTATVGAAALGDHYWNFLPSGKLDWESISTILSGLSWGLGYFGMPHILVRFMSAKDTKTIKQSRVIAIVWVIIALSAAVAIGLIGRVFLPELLDGERELVFIQMVRGIFPAFIAGLLLAGILAASMSTADSQLLVSASAFSADLYKPIFRKNASDKEMMWASRLVVFAITIVATVIALNPNSGNIMNLVENAWGGFGSAFGPVIILSLFWKRLNYAGAVAGILTGAIVDVLWLLFLTSSTGLYELLPGFLCGFIATVVVTLATKKPDAQVEELFDASVKAND